MDDITRQYTMIPEPRREIVEWVARRCLEDGFFNGEYRQSVLSDVFSKYVKVLEDSNDKDKACRAAARVMARHGNNTEDEEMIHKVVYYALKGKMSR